MIETNWGCPMKVVVVIDKDERCHVYPYNNRNLRHLLTHVVAHELTPPGGFDFISDHVAKFDAENRTAEEIEDYIRNDLRWPESRLFTTIMVEDLPAVKQEKGQGFFG